MSENLDAERAAGGSGRETLEVLGLRCPEPLMLIRQKLREIDIGSELEIVADDPATLRDVPNLCQHLGYTLVSGGDADAAPYVFVVRK